MRSTPNGKLPDSAPRDNIVHVTIGRNIGRVPMALPDWATFSTAVRDRLAWHLEGATVTEHDGTGDWEGVREESVVITAYGAPVTLNAQILLTRDLATLARNFEQDAIAVTFGRSVLVKPTDG